MYQITLTISQNVVMNYMSERSFASMCSVSTTSAPIMISDGYSSDQLQHRSCPVQSETKFA